MKKITLPMIACLALASSAFAGQEVKDTRETVPDEPCFKVRDLQLDVFGTWTDVTKGNPHSNGFGGGLGVNYFFIKYLGVGIDGDVYDGGSRAVADVTGRLIARFPIEAGGFCIAPYAFTGGGLLWDDVTVGTWHVGGGLEWRATHHIGVFSEGRYTWGGGDRVDAAQVRAGVRIVF